MSTFKNKVQLIGNLGVEPELKELESGKMVVNLSFATDETYLDAKGRKVTETQWHRLVGWDKVAELMHKHLHKGDRAAIEGKLVYRSYEDEDKVKRFVAEVVVSRFLKLSASAREEVKAQVAA